MADPLITLTTDFGPSAPYVAAMKGAILSVNPVARLIDLSHALPAQDLHYCSFFLKHSLRFFPEGTIHVVVVDPGVGTERAILCIELEGQKVLAPDNGCWTEWAGQLRSVPRVWQLTEKRWWRSEVSATFHGRDVFAPAAGHLSRGEAPAQLGKPVGAWAKLNLPAPSLKAGHWVGEVLFVDDFGNLITNLPAKAWGAGRPGDARMMVGEREVERWVRTYGEAKTGALVGLVSSAGMLEAAIVRGNAARELGVERGTPVLIRWETGSAPAEGKVAE